MRDPGAGLGHSLWGLGQDRVNDSSEFGIAMAQSSCGCPAPLGVQGGLEQPGVPPSPIYCLILFKHSLCLTEREAGSRETLWVVSLDPTTLGWVRMLDPTTLGSELSVLSALTPRALL